MEGHKAVRLSNASGASVTFALRLGQDLKTQRVLQCHRNLRSLQ